MKKIKIKSYCKINLFLKVLNKLKNGYHNIQSLVTFCDLHDVISVSENPNSKDKISFSGKFKKGISSKSNTVTKLLNLLRREKLLENKNFNIKIKKNIPHGSGLGGGSSNAAQLLNYFNLKMNLKLNQEKMKKFASQIGFDVPIIIKKKNTFITGKNNEILRSDQKFRLNLLIVYPNIVCSTKKIYKKNKKKSYKTKNFFNKKKGKKLIDFLIEQNNDLEKTATQMYPKIGTIINYIKCQNGCYFSRITGSGSACIGIFSNMEKAINAQKLMKLKYPNYWCVVSKTI